MLFRALVGTNDWKAAEALVSADESPAHRLGEVAIAARRAGETREATRIWARRTNLDRLSPDGISSMANAGGRDAVLAHYVELAARDPQFRWVTTVRLTPAAGTPPRPGSGPRR
jgi:hypothetical protein